MTPEVASRKKTPARGSVKGKKNWSETNCPVPEPRLISPFRRALIAPMFATSAGLMTGAVAREARSPVSSTHRRARPATVIREARRSTSASKLWAAAAPIVAPKAIRSSRFRSRSVPSLSIP